MHYLGLGHPRQDAGASSPTGEKAGARDRRQLRRDPLGARGDGDPARHRPRPRDARAAVRPRAVPSSSTLPRRDGARAPSTSIAALAELDVDLEIVEGLHHDEAFERYRDADIVVDQLNAGWYGLFAIECMALGKPVVTFLHDEAVRRTEEAFGTPVPIVSATAETLRERLAPARRRRGRAARGVGAASRAYVERVHDLERVTDRLLDVYARL